MPHNHRMINPLVSTKHFLRVILQISNLGLFLRPMVSFYIKWFASRFFDGAYVTRGSFYTKDWIPFVSDVDLNIVGNTFTERQKIIKKQLFYLNEITRIDITAKFTNSELDQLCYQAGLYYHHSSPWLNNKLIAKRRNLWLCLREIINRYPEHARSTTNFVYIPKNNQKQRWLEFARDIGLEHLAQKIITEEDLSLLARFSARACENIFWENYWVKFQIIQAMPRIDKYFNENEEYSLRSADDLKFKPIKIHSLDELREHYLEPKNKTPFPDDRWDIYPFLPKIGLTSIKHETSKIPKLAILQWALETVVVFYDNPYVYKIDPASLRRLEDCIYNRLPLLSSIINQTKILPLQNKKLDDKMIQDHYILAEQLLRRAMQLNNLLP